jgi:aspartate aminotransferase
MIVYGERMDIKVSKKGAAVSASPTLAIDSKFKAMKASGIDVVGFGTGEPDFDTPDHIKQAAKVALDKGFTKYTPASGTIDLKNAVVRKLKRENNLDYTANDIVISNGAKHSLTNVFMAICNPGDEVIVPAPYWVSYPEMIKLADGVPVILETTEDNDFKFTVSDIKKMLTDKTIAIILCSPSNPTGSVYSVEELKEIADFCVKNNIVVVSDEVYEHLIYEGDTCSIASLNDEIKALTITVNAVSKTYAMTGWRIGYTASPANIAKAMSNIQSHATSNPNSIAQEAAVAALDGSLDCVYEMKKHFLERRNYMVDRINKIPGLSCRMPKGAFYVMMNISKIKGKEIAGVKINTSDDFCDVMLDKALVALVGGSGFGADDFVRWSYAASMDSIKKGLDRLEEILK